jgi:hypothetical protein
MDDMTDLPTTATLTGTCDGLVGFLEDGNRCGNKTLLVVNDDPDLYVEYKVGTPAMPVDWHAVLLVLLKLLVAGTMMALGAVLSSCVVRMLYTEAIVLASGGVVSPLDSLADMLVPGPVYMLPLLVSWLLFGAIFALSLAPQALGAIGFISGKVYSSGSRFEGVDGIREFMFRGLKRVAFGDFTDAVPNLIIPFAGVLALAAEFSPDVVGIVGVAQGTSSETYLPFEIIVLIVALISVGLMLRVSSLTAGMGTYKHAFMTLLMACVAPVAGSAILVALFFGVLALIGIALIPVVFVVVLLGALIGMSSN